jgi:hypothetical protein
MADDHPIEDAIAKFMPQRHRPNAGGPGQMPPSGTADRLAVLTLLESLEKQIEESHKRVHEAIQRIRDQMALADERIAAASQKMNDAAQDMIDANRSLRG